MTRKPGPVPEEYWGCARKCFEQGEHTAVWGECEKASPPPCEHPAEDIAWDRTRFCVVCGSCGQEVTVQGLAEQARVSLSMGCTCPDDTESDTCAERPVGWSLDPAKVLACIQAERQGTRDGRSMMVTFRQEDWDQLLEIAGELKISPEHLVGTSARRWVRRAMHFRD